MCKCKGCGVLLQSDNLNELGYTKNLKKELCERCFRIRNYNDYKLVVSDNNDYTNILKKINNTKDLVILVVDIFNISKNLDIIRDYLSNDILLVITKRDILPKSCYDKKLIEYFNKYFINPVDSIIVSSYKNYNFDELYDKISKYKKSKNVYIVGFTNSGKSTMINKVIYNYSNLDSSITTSPLPSTTIDLIKIEINDTLCIIDTPGLLNQGDIINYIEKDKLKKIIPTKEIRPITYQIKKRQKIVVEDILVLDINGNTNVTIYLSNLLNINRVYKKEVLISNFKELKFDVKNHSDIVIQGLGFIKFTSKCEVFVYTYDGVDVYLRDNLI